MHTPPPSPKIYHITHLRNLAAMAKAGAIYSDARRLKLNVQCEIVGMSKIKQRRLTQIEVNCHAGTKVGEYAPFYFCPRSIMLFLLHKGNHPDLNYKEGQQPIVHLQADLTKTIAWADKRGVRWAISDGNAGSFGTNYYTGAAALGQINWAAVATNSWADPAVKEGKQAEFLLWDEFPWSLIEGIGVCNAATLAKATAALTGAAHSPAVAVKSAWYY
jgi:hypothetical protein